jgi:hypothetical protein
MLAENLAAGSDQVVSYRLATTVAVSVLIHAVVLGSLNLPDTRGDRPSLIPELFVHLEPESDVEVEDEQLPPPVASQASPMQAPDVLESPRAPEPAPQQLASAEEVRQEASPSPSESEIVTTSAESYPEETPGAQPEPQATVSVSIAETEQQMLTRRIIKEVQNTHAVDSTQVRLSWQDGDRSYVAMVTPKPATSATDIDRAVVEIEVEGEGKRQRTRMYVKRLAFSHFAQIVDRWDPEIQIHDDIVAGRFHSNSAIMLSYDRKVAPLFLGKATTAARDFGFGARRSFRKASRRARARSASPPPIGP